MKKINLLKLLLVFTLMIFMGNVSALTTFPDSITIDYQGDTLTIDSSLNVIEGQESTYYPWFHHKKSNIGSIICTNHDMDAPGSGTTCTKSNWDEDKHKYGVAYIIKTIVGSWGTVTPTNEQYYWIEMLSKGYIGEYTSSEGHYFYDNVMTNSDFKILNTGKTWAQIISEASNYANDDHKPAMQMIAENNKLTFTLGDDGWYYSNEVQVMANVKVTPKLSSNKFSYDVSNTGVYVFKIKQSDVAAGSTEKLTVTFEGGSQTVYVTQRYDCGSSVQEVALTQLVGEDLYPDSKSISGSVTRAEETGKLIIKKVDASGNHLQGAKIRIDGPNGYSKIIETGTKAYELSNLAYGTYTVTETAAPSGYVLVSQTQTKVISSETPTITFTFKNDLTETTISKKDVTTEEELAGATLQILDKDKKTISCKKQTSTGIQTLEKCSWTSETTATKIVGLPAGTYYLKEIIAPSGYVLSAEVKEFTVKADGTVNSVVMYNNLTQTVVSKKDATTGEELDGATLQILNSKKEEISCIKLEGDKRVTLDKCSWISGTTSTKIVGLPVGTYYLKETIAPEGYILNTELKEFEVKNNGTINKVEMTNEFTKVVISKKSSSTGKELAGATLQILDSNKKKMKCTMLQNGEYVEKDECSWTSGTKKVEIVGLSVGKYYLKELEAPEGYVLNKDLKAFEIKNSTDSVEVEMTNDLTKTIVKKKNNVDGDLLAGATLQILDEDQKPIECTIIKDDKEKKLDDCSWVTEDKEIEIVGLPAGQYYLKELKAPTGYILNESLVGFEVKNTKKTTEVEMVNVLEVDIPDTLSARSVLLITISMFDIALGIGILTYVKKNKTQE